MPPPGGQWIEYVKAQRSYPVTVRPDGSLQFDSVEPGKYILSVHATVPGNQPWNSKTITTGSAEVTVPPEATPTTPIPIGEIVLKPVDAP